MPVIDHHMNVSDAWRSVLEQLNQAPDDPGHAFRYVNLATVTADNVPSQRTVVLREFDQEEHILTIFTDARSNKVRQIRNNDSISLLFYDHDEKLQLTIQGQASLITEGDKKMEYWYSSGSKGAHSYTSVKSPGEIIETPDEAYDWNLDSAEYFCVIEIKAEHMEFLQLSGHRHLRSSQFFSEGSWKQHWIAP